MASLTHPDPGGRDQKGAFLSCCTGATVLGCSAFIDLLEAGVGTPSPVHRRSTDVPAPPEEPPALGWVGLTGHGEGPLCWGRSTSVPAGPHSPPDRTRPVRHRRGNKVQEARGGSGSSRGRRPAFWLLPRAASPRASGGASVSTASLYREGRQACFVCP